MLLEQLLQVLKAQVCVLPNAFENLGVKDLSGVKRDRGPSAGGIPADLVAAAFRKSRSVQDGSCLAGRYAR